MLWTYACTNCDHLLRTADGRGRLTHWCVDCDKQTTFERQTYAGQ